jgi:hypothetical protein
MKDLIVSLAVKKLSPFVEFEGSIPYSQEASAGAYAKPNESSPQLRSLFL